MARRKASTMRREAVAPDRRPWRIHFFQRHRENDPSESVPGRDYLATCPVAARMLAVLTAVAEAPPPTFSGGGMWEAMHDEMAGFYEVRVDHKERHYRLFCILERNGAVVGLGGPAVVVIEGMDKAFRATFTDIDYERVRKLGREFHGRTPRSDAS